MEETGVPRENNRPAANHGQTLSHNVVSSTPRHEWSDISTCEVFIQLSLFQSINSAL
jgi:hypothetical protein